ncbi:MAG: TetR/AcrR family transcriptional regulator [Myxococcales bacterium]|nr:TetR/AcrR family transcriptional regulator [Myxococcales bacterium]
MRKEERRSQVLRCARKVFAEKGYHAAGVADIIREAGVARGTFYLYFESKRAIFDELLDVLFQELESQIRRVDPTGGAEDSARQMLDNVGRVLDTLLRNRDLTRILLREAVGLDAGFDRKLDEFYRRLAGLIERSLVSGREMGLVRELDRRVASLMILGALKQVLDHSLADPDSLPAAPELAREFLGIVLTGVVRPGTMMLPGEGRDTR